MTDAPKPGPFDGEPPAPESPTPEPPAPLIGPLAPLRMEGNVVASITECGETIPANSPLKVTMDESVRWEGRPDRPVAESSGLVVKQYVRRVVYALRPDPPPPPPRPYTGAILKPSEAKKAKGRRKPSDPVECPCCGGMGGWNDGPRGRYMECDLCNGATQVAPSVAEVWREGAN